MTKIYQLKNLDCANCAAKIERAAKKMDGVNDVNISFMTQRLIIDAEESQLGSILPELQKIITKIEPSTELLA